MEKRRVAAEKRRLLAVKTLDGCFNPDCAWTGSYEGLMELHHKVPAGKLFAISRGFKSIYSLDEFKAELEKCIPLCCNCHRGLHAGLWHV